MNPRALLKATASAFRNAGIPDPEVDAALLLSHVTGQPPLSLRLDMTTVLSDDVLTRFDALVSRRLTRPTPCNICSTRSRFWGVISMWMNGC